MDSNELVREINDSLSMTAAPGISMDELNDLVAVHINSLIQTDFQKLIYVLYRVDVSELKLKQLLKQNPGTDAGKLIASLIIERQVQKIESRHQHGKRTDDFAGEEKW
jgi:hypothetical protein